MKVWSTVTDQGLGVPYLPKRHADGNRNHGYFDLKKTPDKISEIPEIQGCPELESFVKVVNSPDSCFQTLGSEKSFSDSESPQFKRKLVSYVDLAFEILEFNARENFERLFDRFRNSSSHRLSESTGVEFEIGPATYRVHHFPGWRVTVWNFGYGQTDAEARVHWALGLEVLREFLSNESRLFSQEHKGNRKTIT